MFHSFGIFPILLFVFAAAFCIYFFFCCWSSWVYVNCVQLNFLFGFAAVTVWFEVDSAWACMVCRHVEHCSRTRCGVFHEWPGNWSTDKKNTHSYLDLPFGATCDIIIFSNYAMPSAHTIDTWTGLYLHTILHSVVLACHCGSFTHLLCAWIGRERWRNLLLFLT